MVPFVYFYGISHQPNHQLVSADMDKEWVKKHTTGGNTLLLTEELIGRLPLPKGSRILELGAGKCLSAVLLAQTFDAEVWAIDKNEAVNDNFQTAAKFPALRIVPLQLDARLLPFPEHFFDAIISINAIHYFGTDDKFLPYISRFLRPGGIMGIADICFSEEFQTAVDAPEYLQAEFHYYFQHLHALHWWKNKWERTGLLDRIEAKYCSDLRALKQAYIDTTQEAPDAFTRALLLDSKNSLRFFTMTGSKNELKPFLE